MIEVEKRALISNAKNDELLIYLNSNSKKLSEVKRYTLVKVQNSDFTSDPNNDLDIKIRTTKNESLFTVKKGNWHDSSGRKENEIHFQNDEISEIVNMLTSLGFNYFVSMYVTRKKYELNGLIITIDSYHHMDEILVEVEKTVDEKSSTTIAEKDIEDFFLAQNLKVLNSEDTISFINKINQIEETQVDFTKLSVDQWFSQWKEFISCNI